MQVLQAQQTSQETMAAQLAAALQGQADQQTMQYQNLATVITQQQAQAQLMQGQLDQLSQGLIAMMQQAAVGGISSSEQPTSARPWERSRLRGWSPSAAPSRRR